MRKDQAIVAEANRLSEQERQKAKDKHDLLKKKLQDMNVERD